MATVLVSGAGSLLGRRVAELAASDPDRPTIVAVVDGTIDPSTTGPLDVVLLVPGTGPDRDGSSLGGVDLGTATVLLAAVEHLDVRHVVVLSSAMVYGAWRDNPVPITEEAVLRPNPGCRYAADKAELERLASEWAIEHDVTVAVLRPALTVAATADGVEWMESSLWHSPTARHGEEDPPGQFLLAEDLARAVEHARRHQLAGTFNVAPDGWLTVDRQVELSGRSGRVRIPGPVVGRVAAFRWRWRLTSTPPDVVPYTMHPWVIANDRLRSTGWEPTSSNDETFVAVNREGWWASLDARHRQDVALGGVTGAMAVLVGVVAWALRRRVGRQG